MSTKMINELNVIIAMADQLKDKATSLKRKLAPFQGPAPKGDKKRISPIQEARLLVNRTKKLNRL